MSHKEYNFILREELLISVLHKGIILFLETGQALILVTRNIDYTNHLLYFEKKEIIEVLLFFINMLKKIIYYSFIYLSKIVFLINKLEKLFFLLLTYTKKYLKFNGQLKFL